MTRTRFALVAMLGACAVIACSLNPQPLPPSSPDGSFGGDAAGALGDGESPFDDGGVDAASDSSPAPSLDGASDASEADADGASDSGRLDGGDDADGA